MRSKLILAVLTVSLFSNAEVCLASNSVNADAYCDAIYRIEGGSKTRHPYGILAKYKHTSPRQACLNTVNNNYKRWLAKGKPGRFNAFLANVYAPIGATNDPSGLNRNWLRNLEAVMV